MKLVGSVLNTHEICFSRVNKQQHLYKVIFMFPSFMTNDFFKLLNGALIFLKILKNLPLSETLEICSQPYSEDIPDLSLHSCSWQSALHAKSLPKYCLDPPNHSAETIISTMTFAQLIYFSYKMCGIFDIIEFASPACHVS